jgi:hypothetical protein
MHSGQNVCLAQLFNTDATGGSMDKKGVYHAVEESGE